MKNLAHEAEGMWLLLRLGAVGTKEVIAWTDLAIARLEAPPIELLELSVTKPDHIADVLFWLHRLSVGGDPWLALRRALPHVRKYVASHPERAEQIANAMFLEVFHGGYSGMPEDLRFILRIEEAYSLARDGIHGDLQTAGQEFALELEKFAGSSG